MNTRITQVKALALSLAVALSAFTAFPMDAEAKRLGGGGSFGRSAPSAPQKSMPSNNQAAPTQQQATKQTAAPQQGAQAAPKRNWLGPIAGIAAGLGLAALFSHLGLGEGMGTFFLMLLMGVAAFFIIRKIMGAMKGQTPRPAYAAGQAGTQSSSYNPSSDNTMYRQRQDQQDAPVAPVQPAAQQSGTNSGVSAWDSFGNAQHTQSNFDIHESFGNNQQPIKQLPAGFDEFAFLNSAKKFFNMMQDQFDKGDLKTLGEYCTDEVLDNIAMDLRQRGSQVNVTEVLELNAELIGFETDVDEQIATVVFTGQVREAAGAPVDQIEEMWVMSRPVSGGGWVLAGIHNL